MSHRPEHVAPPEIYYNAKEALKYTQNSRMIEIQLEMTDRAVELLHLPENQSSFLLDLGCGSGLSGEHLTELGHYWLGLDISSAMLEVARERDVKGGLFLQDMGQGISFRPGTFDGAISISALQWLCNADKKSHNPIKRLNCLFSTLYSVLKRGSRAVFQFYPENSDQMELITFQAMKVGFTGGVVIDYPNSTKAKKMYLCLFTGGASTGVPKALGTEAINEITFENRRGILRKKTTRKNHKVPFKSREWILAKKERRRRQGKEQVRPDTKYTGRKRKSRF